MRTGIAVYVLAAGLAATAPAASSSDFHGNTEGSHVPSNPRFGDVDRNHDGQISQQEASGNPDLEQLLHQNDLNNDGQLSAEEYQGLVHEPRG